jgi:hypothetical protein
MIVPFTVPDTLIHQSDFISNWDSIYEIRLRRL